MRPDQLQRIENADTVYILEAGIYHCHTHPFPTESGIMQFDSIQHFDLPFSISVFLFQRSIRRRKTDLLIIFLGRSHIMPFPYHFTESTIVRFFRRSATVLSLLVTTTVESHLLCTTGSAPVATNVSR